MSNDQEYLNLDEKINLYTKLANKTESFEQTSNIRQKKLRDFYRSKLANDILELSSYDKLYIKSVREKVNVLLTENSPTSVSQAITILESFKYEIELNDDDSWAIVGGLARKEYIIFEFCNLIDIFPV